MAQSTNTNRLGFRIDVKTPDDSQIEDRDRFGRWVFLIACSFLMFAVPTWFLGYWGSIIHFPTIGGLLGFGLGGYIASIIIPDRFLINNPEWTAYVTQNMFTGKMIPYGPGLHPAYPWEEHSKDGNYPLNIITRSFPINIATKTSAVVVNVEYEYAISLRGIMRAIGVDESTIENGIIAFMESFLTSVCAKHEAEWARSHIDALNKDLAVKFMGIEVKGVTPQNFESIYGFVTVSIVINHIGLPPAVQKTRDAIDEAVQLHEVVAKLYGMTVEELKTKLNSGAISKPEYDKMLNRAMATSDNATMDISVVEGAAVDVAGKIVSQLVKGGKGS